MFTIGDNIRALRIRENLTQSKLALKLRVTKETVSRWETNKINISSTSLNKIMTEFKVTEDEILNTNHGLAYLLYQKEETNNTINFKCDNNRIPIFSISNCSGVGNQLVKSHECYIPIDVALRHKSSFLVQISSDEMSRLYPIGSLTLIDKTLQPWNGCSVCAYTETEGVVIRRYKCDMGTVTLSTWSYTSSVPEIEAGFNDIEVLGVVVWYQAGHDYC